MLIIVLLQGVYYLYNFDDKGAGKGGVSWPWGADKLFPKAGIQLKVRNLDGAGNYAWAHSSSTVGDRILCEDVQGIETKRREEPVRL